MVDVADLFMDFDSTAHVVVNDELDLAFLEVIDQQEGFFAINDTYFKALNNMEPEPVFVPSLHSSIFEQPLNHAVWTSNWPQTNRHFPA